MRAGHIDFWEKKYPLQKIKNSTKKIFYLGFHFLCVEEIQY